MKNDHSRWPKLLIWHLQILFIHLFDWVIKWFISSSFHIVIMLHNLALYNSKYIPRISYLFFCETLINLLKSYRDYMAILPNSFLNEDETNLIWNQKHVSRHQLAYVGKVFCLVVSQQLFKSIFRVVSYIL